MRRICFLVAALAALSVATRPSRADSPPDWVKSVLAESVGESDNNASCVVLLDERVTTVRGDGSSETRSRYAVRVLTEEGRAAARREIQYDSQTRIRDLHAWHIRADQKVFELQQDKVTEHAINEDLYSDIRSKVMRFGEVEIGSVVAFEWVRKEKPLVNQDYHFFQSKSPVFASRYQLNLPPGWQVKALVFNHEPIRASVSGNSHIWELKGLHAIKEEPMMPDSLALSPYLAVSYFPPKDDGPGKAFSSWREVSAWAERIMRCPVRAHKSIEAKAAEITGSLVSEPEKVRAIAGWVQEKIRYASIQLGTLGGYRPNPPDTVLKKGYGDCKDKSSLMQALLQAKGVTSYPVLVFAGDPTRVRPEFASPLQFNHAIIAIEVKEEGQGVLDHPRLRRLMFFDPTDGITPIGDLPFYLQGSYGLVVKGESGDLLRLPDQTENRNTLSREIAVRVSSSGEVTALVKEAMSGQLATATRRRLASSGEEEYAKEVASRVARDLPGARLSGLRINHDGASRGQLGIEYRVEAGGFPNRVNKLLVIRPVLLWAQQFPLFTDPERQHPILFEMKSVKEDIVKIELPEGFKLDEVPPDTSVRSSAGEFGMTYEVAGSEVIVRRRLVLNKQVLPASDYTEVKKFFETARSASQASIVLTGSQDN
jgi:uncharacterized protein DUF3857/transglutaminase superfamily protein